jgi:hypothetical protein
MFQKQTSAELKTTFVICGHSRKQEALQNKGAKHKLSMLLVSKHFV